MPSHLEPSSLGTKEHWDDLYTTEITNHTIDPTDEGTVWFDDSSAEDKIAHFLKKQVIDSKLLGEGVASDNCSFLDLGTGNGHFLMRLSEGGNRDEEEDTLKCRWRGRMLGVDYSEKSVELARRVARDRGLEVDDGKNQLAFMCWDVIAHLPEGIVLNGDQRLGWDVVLDKGTFDAISLSEERDQRGDRICESYKQRILPLVKEGGIFLVTSCNWTEEELNAWFEGEGFKFVESIKYKSFSFGGKKGQTTSSVCYKKYHCR